MASRIDLHNELCNVLGSRNVYFQPPESIKMNYPAIVYSRSNIENIAADNDTYIQNHYYQVIVIDQNPDSLIVDRVSKMRFIRFVNHYVSDNLNHDVFTLYY